jgi:hypothetical protein
LRNKRNSSTRRIADVWCAIPKVIFSRTLDSVQGNARLAEAYLRGVEAELLLVGVPQLNSPSRSAIKPSAETLIE